MMKLGTESDNDYGISVLWKLRFLQSRCHCVRHIGKCSLQPYHGYVLSGLHNILYE